MSMTSPIEIIQTAISLVETLANKRFPGPVELIPGDWSYAHTPGCKSEGLTQIGEGVVKRGFAETVRVCAHELGHHVLAHTPTGYETEMHRRQQLEADIFATRATAPLGRLREAPSDPTTIVIVDGGIHPDYKEAMRTAPLEELPGLARLATAQAFGALREVPQEEIVARYLRAVTEAAPGIDPDLALRTATILTEEDIRRDKKRVELNTSQLEESHVKSWEHLFLNHHLAYREPRGQNDYNF